MLIFDCDDPKVRAQRAQALGVRLANHIDRERYQRDLEVVGPPPPADERRRPRFKPLQSHVR